MTTRRNFLRIAGSSAVILAAGAGSWAATRTPHAALAPWGNAGQYPDAMRRALSWAILAPNPHNRQPWLVDLVSDSEAILFVDTDRLLPHTDPYNRQITIGLGAFLEVFRLAAAQDRLNVHFAYFPDGESADQLDTRPIARIRLQGETAPDPLFGAILQRHTNREPYKQDRPVSADLLDDIAGSAGRGGSHGVTVAASAEASHVETLRSLAGEAMQLEMMTDRTYMESVDLMRFGKADINASPDGLSMPGPMLELLHALGPMSYETLSNLDGAAQASSARFVEHQAATAMAWMWFTTATNTRTDQILAGRDYVRGHLRATQLGLAWQPMSQALQEYVEMDDLYTQLHTMLAPGGERVQMLVRLGYAADAQPTPRWPLETKILDT